MQEVFQQCPGSSWICRFCSNFSTLQPGHRISTIAASFHLKRWSHLFGSESSPGPRKPSQHCNAPTSFRGSHWINIPQRWPLQKCLWHHARGACSSSSGTGSRCPTAAAQQQPGSWSGWRAARCCRSPRHGPRGGRTDLRPGATRLQLLPLRGKGWEGQVRRETIWVLETRQRQKTRSLSHPLSGTAMGHDWELHLC